MQSSNVGIQQTAVILGDRTVTAEELAQQVSARPEVAQRWLGNLTLHVSDRSPAELAAEAGLLCLRRSGLSIEDVPLIIFGSSAPLAPLEEGRRELRVQELLGAKGATITEVGTACSESITALKLACAFVRTEPGIDRVLLVFGERRSSRILGYDKETYQPVFSDAGAALLVQRDARLQVLGFGDATDGRYWDFIAEIRRSEGAKSAPAQAGTPPTQQMDPRRLRLMTDGVALNRLALQRCLAAAVVTPGEIRHVLLTREGPRVPHALLRQLDLDPGLLPDPNLGPTHAGMADFVISLDVLMAGSTLRPGAALLLGSRAVGATRFCLARA
jgi:3-oxoacyl-[acyl-carrier-protein] synthase III